MAHSIPGVCRAIALYEFNSEVPAANVLLLRVFVENVGFA